MKVIDSLLSSNHYKHLIGGFLVAIPSINIIDSIYVSIIAGCCLEYKDKRYGNDFDFVDLFYTVLGGTIATILKLWMQVI